MPKLICFMKRRRMLFYCFMVSLHVLVFSSVRAQTFTPVPVTGFNQDVIAEGGPSSIATTTIAMDGNQSNTVLFTSAFRAFAGLTYGGIPDNGTLVNGTSTYQLAPYTGNNALLLQRTQAGDLTLSTPAQLSRIRLLALSTEGASLVNVRLTFTDGTTTNALTNYSLPDWFNGGNVVMQALGRVTRGTAPYSVSGQSTNPRMYFIDYSLNCADKLKVLSKVTVTNVTTAGNNAPFPNAVFFGLSGVGFSQSISTTSITPTGCIGNTGGATIAVSGSATPYNISWNTNPVQTGTAVSGLPAGTYTAAITDAAACVTNYPVTIPFQSNLALTVHADTTICRGASFASNTVSNGSAFSWTPAAGVSNTAIASPLLSPTATTTYIVTAVLGTCAVNKSFTVTVADPATINAGPDVTILAGDVTQLAAAGSAGTYQWTPSAGLSSATILNPTASPAQTTTYTIQVTTPNGCKASDNVTVNVVPNCVKPMEAFSPNGDGINDRWLVTNGGCATTVKAQVFNRYGNIVFESGNYNNDWDGKYKGKAVADGTYYYAILYTLINGKTVFMKGNLTILR